MKNIKNKIKFIAAAAVMGATVTGCSLDQLPLNEVVLENFWTNKEDVQSLVNSCYDGMQSEGYVNSLMIWGEVRSDNVDNGDRVDVALQDLQNGNIRTTHSFCDWSSMYTVINRCNTVLKYAPEVAAKDPNYTDSDLKVTVAECKALRAISYLNLIKTFKAVPFTFQPSTDDTQEYRLPATPFETILDSLIDDLEPVKNDAPLKNIRANGFTSAQQSSGRITRAAMYSILAELYLWKASDYKLDAGAQQQAYRKCIECCDWVINYKIRQFENDEFGDNPEALRDEIDKDVYGNYGIPLLAEELGVSSSRKALAFTSIFMEGNSFEGIFEITYKHTSDDLEDDKNFAVPRLYGGSVKKDQSTEELDPAIHGNNNLCPTTITGSSYNDKDVFPVKSDYRSVTAFAFSDGGTFPIAKYAITDSYSSSFQSRTHTVGQAWKGLDKEVVSSYRPSSWQGSYSNWIIYRLTEIILFRAEAEIELAKLITPVETPETPSEGEGEETPSEGGEATRAIIGNGSSLATAEELYNDAFNLIRCVYDRSNPYVNRQDSYAPKRSNYPGYTEMFTLLMNERRREFLFEGKRYFDLVRQARRVGNTKDFSQAITKKFSGASKAVAVKMAMMDFMYLPYLRQQMKVNPNLVQNPAYQDEEETVKQ